MIKNSLVLIMGLAYKENIADMWESPARGIVEELSDFGVEVYGLDPLLSREEIEGFGVRVLDDMLQITDYCPKGVDGVIVAVAHDEFRGMGLSGVSGVLGEGMVFVLFTVAGSLAASQVNVFVHSGRRSTRSCRRLWRRSGCGIITPDNDGFKNVLADGFFSKYQSKKHTGYLSTHTKVFYVGEYK